MTDPISDVLQEFHLYFQSLVSSGALSRFLAFAFVPVSLSVSYNLFRSLCGISNRGRRLPYSERIKARPVKVEPVKVESVKVEPVKVEPVKVEPVKVEPVKVEPVFPPLFVTGCDNCPIYLHDNCKLRGTGFCCIGMPIDFNGDLIGGTQKCLMQ